MRYLGEEIAKEYGFRISYYSSDRCNCLYINDNGICLNIYKHLNGEDMLGTLNFSDGILNVSIEKFNLPNKNFELFLEQINNAYMKIKYGRVV